MMPIRPTDHLPQKQLLASSQIWVRFFFQTMTNALTTWQLLRANITSSESGRELTVTTSCGDRLARLCMKLGAGPRVRERRVVMIGDTNVGKTSIVTRLKFGTFDVTESPTIAAEFLNHEECVGDDTLILQIWDTSGQERYRCLGPIYYRDAVGAILVFDVTRPQTFEGLDSWLSVFKSVAPDGVVVVLANKSDAKTESGVTDSEIASWVAKHDNEMRVFSTSAATGDGIEEAFHALAQQVHDVLKTPAATLPVKLGGNSGHGQLNCC
jgi:small GTP-binding protein